MAVRTSRPRGVIISPNSTLPEQVYWVAENVGREVAQEIEWIKEAFVAGGPPLGFEKLNPVDRILQYINIHFMTDPTTGELVLNPDGWWTWMNDQYEQWSESIKDALPADRKKYHLTDLDLRQMAVRAAIDYRDQVERLIVKTYPPDLAETPGPMAPPLLPETSVSMQADEAGQWEQ